MPKANQTPTTPAAATPPVKTEPAKSWTIGDVESLLYDMEAQTGILGHIAASGNPIEPGQLVAVEDELIELQKRLMTLWHSAWDEHLAFRFGARAPVAADAVWDLLRSTAKVVLEQCDHPERIPSAPTTAGPGEALRDTELAKGAPGNQHTGPVGSTNQADHQSVEPTGGAPTPARTDLVGSADQVNNPPKARSSQPTELTDPPIVRSTEPAAQEPPTLADVPVSEHFKRNPYVRPDAGLLHIAHEFAKVERQIQVLNEMPDETPDDVGRAVADRQYGLTDVMIDIPAKTAAGWRAKAQVLVASIRLDVVTMDHEHHLAVSLAEDLLREIKPDR